MSHGIKKTIRIGFIIECNNTWLGGVNYYKNLFLACSKVSQPELVPCLAIEPDAKNNTKNMGKYIDFFQERKTKSFRYYLQKFLHLFSNKKFEEDKYKRSFYNVDLFSHSLVSKHPSISWIPDFQHMHLSNMFEEKEIIHRNKYFKTVAKKSKFIVFSSQNAFEDFKQFSPKHAKKGRILHFVSYIDPIIYENTENIKSLLIEKYDLPEKYFYLPNQFWKHKNHMLVFEALAILKSQNIDIKLVMTGNQKDRRNCGHFENLMEYVKKVGIENNLKTLGVIDLNDVYYLMRNCISIINPSLFEGWSSTVEEAKSLGKNIILSDLAVHKEQNPSGAVYFDPHSPQDLAPILKEKWLSNHYGPDYKLEQIAKENMDKRMYEFGLEYQKIILELYNKL